MDINKRKVNEGSPPIFQISSQKGQSIQYEEKRLDTKSTETAFKTFQCPTYPVKER